MASRGPERAVIDIWLEMYDPPLNQRAEYMRPSLSCCNHRKKLLHTGRGSVGGKPSQPGIKCHLLCSFNVRSLL
jgi:hypothetical protein